MSERTFTLKSGREVTLDQNEQIILERMRDEDGTEWPMVFSIENVPSLNYRFVPRDQVDGLALAGLVSYFRFDNISNRPSGVLITDDGREVLVQMRRKAVSRQLSELTMGELIELAQDEISAIEPDLEALKSTLYAMEDLHNRTSDARARIGEYLRQKQMGHVRQEKSKGYTRSKGEEVTEEPMSNVLDEVREDMYAVKARLLVSDLALFAPATVRDTKAKFMEIQQRRLAYVLAHERLSEKQREVLEEVAKGNVSYSSYGGLSWAGKRLDGRTFESLRKRGLLTHVSEPGFGRNSHYCLKRPTAEGYQD